jgi:hypothetical protein
LDDFKDELGDLNTNFYVFVDQLVAARGKVFFGVFHSTFTGYVNRLRGYYSVKEKRDGCQDGIIESFHYAGQKEKNYYRSYRAFSVPAFSREYPVAWRLCIISMQLCPAVRHNFMRFHFKRITTKENFFLQGRISLYL